MTKQSNNNNDITITDLKLMGGVELYWNVMTTTNNARRLGFHVSPQKQCNKGVELRERKIALYENINSMIIYHRYKVSRKWLVIEATKYVHCFHDPLVFVFCNTLTHLTVDTKLSDGTSETEKMKKASA